MKLTIQSWRWPVAIGMVISSLVPVTLLYLIYQLDFRSSSRAFKNIPPPHIPQVFYEYSQLGFLLPVLATALGLWFALSQSVSPTKFAWWLLGLVMLHLLWLSYGILGIYLANQTFMMAT